MEDREGIEMLRKHQEQSDALQPKLDAQLREAGKLADTADPGPDAATETATGTITRYVPWRYPRAFVVLELPSREVEAEFDSFEECEWHASQLNEWLARRPTPHARYRMFVPPPEPTEAALIETIDSIYDATVLEQRAFEPVAVLVREALVAAERDPEKLSYTKSYELPEQETKEES